MSDATQPPDRRILSLVLAAVAAGCLAYACFSTAWLYNPRNRSADEVGFGLVGMFICQDAGDAKECAAMSNGAFVARWSAELADIRMRADKDPSDLQLQAFATQAAEELRASGAFPALGWITLISLAIAALSLVICAGLVAANRRILWPVMPTTTAILGIAVGLITGCVFVALKPGPAGYVGVNRGFFLYGAGVVVGIAAALMLNKLLRPFDPDLLEGSMDPEHY